MARYILTESAKSDIRHFIEYLRQRSPQAASRVRAELRENMRRIAEFPGVGHLRLDVTDQPLRFWSVYSYLIVYKMAKPVQIVRVLHGARDLPRFFNS